MSTYISSLRKLIAYTIVFALMLSPGQAQTLHQTIKGNVIDADSRKPLQGAVVQVVNSGNTVMSDTAGTFKLLQVPIGRQTLVVSLIGYETKVIYGAQVTSGKEVELIILLDEKIEQLDAVQVKAVRNRTRPLNEFASVSARQFSVEETKRYAAAVYDPARMAMNFAGVSNNGDGGNEIVVRGNSPAGLLWRLEGVEIPNPNHFSSLGNSGGAVSMLSSSTIGNSDFYTGAFPAEIGNATSGAFDLKFRSGNKDRREHSFMLGVLGVEASTEGPLWRRSRSSYLVNYRYSTLGVMKSFLNNLNNVLPDYQDLSFKFNIETKKAGAFSFFGLGGLNLAERTPEKDSTKWTDMNQNFKFHGRGKMGVGGISHHLFLNDNSYIQSTLALSTDRYYEKQDTLNPATHYEIVHIGHSNFENDAFRAAVLYNNKINVQNTVRAGIRVNKIGFDFDNKFYDQAKEEWKSVLNSNGSTIQYQAYLQWKHKLGERVTLNTGVHASYFDLNKNYSVEPRASIIYQLSSRQSVSLAAGLHGRPEHLSTYMFENIAPGQPRTFPNKNMKITKAAHFVAAYDKGFESGIRFKSEVYYQHLFSVPVEKNVDGYFSMINYSSVFDLANTRPLVSEGTGKNYGVDVLVEKPFRNNYYFLATSSLFKSQFRNYFTKTFRSQFDRGYTTNIVAGKEWKAGEQKNKVFSLNGKLLWSGGMRESPIDFQASRVEKRAVYLKGKYYTDKVADYFRLDVAFSYKLNRKQSSHTMSLDVQNVTNRQNEYHSHYDHKKEKVERIYQMGFFPVVNYRVEF